MKSRQDTNNTHVKENDLANFYATVFYKVYNMEWLTMDLTSMYNFKDCSFRCVIDKATWDCILCAERSREATERYLSEIYRILNDDGIFIVITYGHRSNRLCFLNQFDWEITMYQLLKPFLGAENSENEKFYNLFVCKKIPSSI
jgi:ubiquinone/menaquinone biosynthesis C-methylase UbiE